MQPNFRNSKVDKLNSAYAAQFRHLRKLIRREPPVDQVFGIERIWMLFLAVIPLFMPITMIRTISGRLGFRARKIAVELYAVAKPVVLFAALIFGLGAKTYLGVIAALFLFDLYVYILGILFLRRLYDSPVSYGRSVLLLFVNYFESVISFAILYLSAGAISRGKDPVTDGMEALYFSVVTSATVGYGDIVPSTGIGRGLVVAQICSSFAFAAFIVTSFVGQLTQTRSSIK